MVGGEPLTLAPLLGALLGAATFPLAYALLRKDAMPRASAALAAVLAAAPSAAWIAIGRAGPEPVALCAALLIGLAGVAVASVARAPALRWSACAFSAAAFALDPAVGLATAAASVWAAGGERWHASLIVTIVALALWPSAVPWPLRALFVFTILAVRIAAVEVLHERRLPPPVVRMLAYAAALAPVIGLVGVLALPRATGAASDGARFAATTLGALLFSAFAAVAVVGGAVLASTRSAARRATLGLFAGGLAGAILMGPHAVVFALVGLGFATGMGIALLARPGGVRGVRENAA